MNKVLQITDPDEWDVLADGYAAPSFDDVSDAQIGLEEGPKSLKYDQRHRDEILADLDKLITKADMQVQRSFQTFRAFHRTVEAAGEALTDRHQQAARIHFGAAMRGCWHDLVARERLESLRLELKNNPTRASH